jgi:hypothetical protein
VNLPFSGSTSRINDPKAAAANPLCIVCQGRDSTCWCCVRRLAGPAPIPPPPRCVHCGRVRDEPGNFLLMVVCVGLEERAFVHARCWPLLDQKENENDPNDD